MIVALLVALASATLFFLELQTGSRLMPVLGGGALVWLGTVVGFQTLLLAGYASVLLPLSGRMRGRLVAGALVLGAAIGPRELAGTVLLGLALPTFLPAALRRGRDRPTVVRGRWIAFSNLGALLGLALHALAEPHWTLATADTFLRAGAVASALGLLLTSRDATSTPEPEGYRPSLATAIAAGAGVFWYMSLHARLEASLPASPQLWATTLGLYLISFAAPFAFGRTERWRASITVTTLVALGATLFVERETGTAARGAGLLALFAGCTAAHAFLRQRFDGERPWLHGAVDTALGGAVAGTLTLVGLPLLVTTAQQLGLAMLALTLLLGSRTPSRVVRATVGVAGIAAAAVATFAPHGAGRVVETVRSWYGEFTVREYDAGSPLHRHYALYHQQTVHGAQYLHPDLVDLPTAYYSIYSGAGIAWRALEDLRGEQPLRVDVVGLGTGALASYSRAGDRIRFLEIDRRNVALSTRRDPLFRYVDLAEGEVEFLVGDGRRLLHDAEAAGAPRLDALVLDAFSGGTVPTHLLTVEAFELYARRVRRDGFLAVHTSNHVLDLRPVVYGAARAIGARAVFVRNRPRSYADFESPHSHLVMQADWIVLAWDPAFWRAFDARARGHAAADEVVLQPAESVTFEGIAPWTDERRSVWSVWQRRVGERERLVAGAKAGDRTP